MRVASWNVLADCYIHGQTLSNPSDFDTVLKWPRRKEMIHQCIVDFAADIYCLQEVDHFESFYRNMMKELGFKCLYVKRPAKRDGCLVAYRADRFRVIGHRELNLDSLSFIDGDRKSSKSKFFKNNVAILVALKDLETDAHLIVANCHIHWNPSLEDVKCAQAAYILEQLAEFRADHFNAPLIWTGDFNSTPTSDVYRILTANLDDRHRLLHELSPLHIARSIGAGNPVQRNAYYGPHTRFLCDASLNRLCRWMRMLGIQIASDNWDLPSDAVTATLPGHATGKSSKAMKASNINAFFDRANKEQRVLLTTSKSLLERNTCPRHARYVDPAKQAQELIAVFHEYGLDLSRDKFLTVCGKCGGSIEIARTDDPRMAGKFMPTDREVYACVFCAHPYWWSDEENSTPAKALRKAEELYQMISQTLNIPPMSTSSSMPNTAVLQRQSSATISTTIATAQGAQIVVKRQDISLLNDLRTDAAQSEYLTEALSSLTITNESVSISVSNTAATSGEAFPVSPDMTTESETLSEEFRIASEIMRARSTDSLPLIQSVFQGNEPEVTNWAGGFMG
jgi:uncharacterized protein with PIN domain/endonuclease/exonuclease/phosphatase family metal-dependent hydrolase